MTPKTNNRNPEATEFPWLVGSTKLTTLWMVRMLVKLGSFEELHQRHHACRSLQIVEKLRLPDFKGADDEVKAAVLARLAASLHQMESVNQRYLLPQKLRSNTDLLRKHLSLTHTECMLLVLAVMLRVDNDLYETGKLDLMELNTAKAIARVIGVPESKVAKALEPSGRLRRSGLIDASSGSSLSDNFKLRRGGLRKLATSRMTTVDDIFGGILATPPAAVLSVRDYPHLEPCFDDLCRLVEDTLKRKRIGTNILLYGLPGTGKTELVRAIAHHVSAPIFEVSCQSEEGTPLNSMERLASAATGMSLLGKRRAILCFDEVEAIFNDGSALFGKPSTAVHAKAWVNQLLERNGVPTFWIANSINGMDPAFARRFDLALRLDAPPQKQRLEILERECNRQLSQEQLHRLSRIDCITPALVTRASSVVRRIQRTAGGSTNGGRLMESVLEGILQAQGHASLAISTSNAIGSSSFKPDLCNSSQDLEVLAGGLLKSMTGRICLHGPPGTGKTAFGQWLADKLGRPLVAKRVSDIQSPLIGVMERNLANAFKTAKRDGAILQIDEVDSFLQDRRSAQRAWEVSQVNEFLTQLENFDGMFVASTNLMENLDQAALRRFDYKIQMDYLRPKQAYEFFRNQLKEWGIGAGTFGEDGSERMNQLRLTPGDFAVIARRHRVIPFNSAEAVMHALQAEVTSSRRTVARPIGFI